MKYQQWYELYSKENCDPNELSSNTFGLEAWNVQQQKIDNLNQEKQRREDAEKIVILPKEQEITSKNTNNSLSI